MYLKIKGYLRQNHTFSDCQLHMVLPVAILSYFCIEKILIKFIWDIQYL